MKTRIRIALMALVRTQGLVNVHVEDVCRNAGVSVGAFAHYMGLTFTEYTHKLLAARELGRVGAVTKSRVDLLILKAHIVRAARDAAAECGYQAVTRAKVADICGVRRRVVYKFFDDDAALRNALMGDAIATGCIPVVAQGLAMRHPATVGAPHELVAEARAYV